VCALYPKVYARDRHLKTRRILSEEGGRFRPPLDKSADTLKAITRLCCTRQQLLARF
jgi:hypothetical protein